MDPSPRIPACAKARGSEMQGMQGLPLRDCSRRYLKLFSRQSAEDKYPEVHLQAAQAALSDEVTDSGDTARDDDPLLPRVARGEHGAMSQCIDRHGPLVWGIILRRVRDHSAAEDLAQEIFTEIWRKAAKHDSQLSSECGYIAMIARRRTIDWLRHKQRLPELTPLPEPDQIAAEAPGPGNMIDRESLNEVLSRLPEETRWLFNLHFDQGLTHAEIAESTGLPLGSVKTRLRRGLIEARALLKRQPTVMTAEGGAR